LRAVETHVFFLPQLFAATFLMPLDAQRERRVRVVLQRFLSSL
jgi:hypothetical protein